MKPRVRHYRDLLVWQKGMELWNLVEDVVEQLPRCLQWSLGGQMHRAALSIPSNIAEGHRSDFRGVFLRNLFDAKASLAELETQLIHVKERGHIPNELADSALALSDEIGRMLRSLSARLRASPTHQRATSRKLSRDRGRKGDTKV